MLNILDKFNMGVTACLLNWIPKVNIAFVVEVMLENKVCEWSLWYQFLSSKYGLKWGFS